MLGRASLNTAACAATRKYWPASIAKWTVCAPSAACPATRKRGGWRVTSTTKYVSKVQGNSLFVHEEWPNCGKSRWTRTVSSKQQGDEHVWIWKKEELAITAEVESR